MTRTILKLVGLFVLGWGATNLWLSGYEQGYQDGSLTAWDKARASMKPVSRAPSSQGSHGIVKPVSLTALIDLEAETNSQLVTQ